MAFKGTIEIFIHFAQFRNIDLFHQGVYQLKTTIYLNNLQCPAQPYMTVEEKKNGNVFKHNPDSIVQQSRLQDTEYWSKAFIIKYCEQTIDLNEGCVFRVELNAFPNIDNQDLYCTVELMHCEMSVITREEYRTDKLQQYMKSVSKFSSKLHNVSNIHEFVPISFDEMHFCNLKTTVHSLLVDFKFQQSTEETFEQFFRAITNGYNKEIVNEFYTGYNKQLKQIRDVFSAYYKQIVYDCISDVNLQIKYTTLNFHNINLGNNLRVIEGKDALVSDHFNLSLKSEQQELCNHVIIETKSLSSQIFMVWYQFLDAFHYLQKQLINKLEQEYLIKIKDRWGESIFQNTQTVTDLSLGENAVGRNHRAVAKQIRSNNYFKLLEPLNIEDLDLFPEAKVHPIVFKEVSQKQIIQHKPTKGLHLIVFVHGYQGNQQDMRIWKNNIAIRYPDHLLLCSSANEESTEQDIMYMGERLAQEVKQWIKEWCPKENFAKLSFIGHSLGGLIMRAAIPHLDRYKDKMFTYLSLATPHLGYSLSSSKMVDTGLWLIRKWKKCICLNQLTLSDNADYRKTCLYKLSEIPGLGWFKNIALVSSYQDSYIPFESARIQRTAKLSQDSEKCRCFNHMINNIIGNLNNDQIERLDVNYEITGKNIDSMIGRTAHIAFLENNALIKLVIYSFDDWFE